MENEEKINFFLLFHWIILIKKLQINFNQKIIYKFPNLQFLKNSQFCENCEFFIHLLQFFQIIYFGCSAQRIESEFKRSNRIRKIGGSNESIRSWSDLIGSRKFDSIRFYSLVVHQIHRLIHRKFNKKISKKFALKNHR